MRKEGFKELKRLKKLFEKPDRDLDSVIVEGFDDLQGRVKNLISARKEFGLQFTANDRHAVEDVRPLFEDKGQKFVDAALSRLFSSL